MLKVLKCYRMDRKETYRCFYNKPVEFKSKISVGKMTGKTTDLLTLLDLRVTLVCIHDLTWHQNDLKVD